MDDVDLAARDGGVERLVDARDPLLLDGDRVDGGDLHLLLGERRAGVEQRRANGHGRAPG